MPASASASLRARDASAVRRAETSTSVLTTAATSRKAATAARSRSLRIVNVWMGSAKNQLRKPNPATAASAAGQRPPTVATSTTSMR